MGSAPATMLFYTPGYEDSTTAGISVVCAFLVVPSKATRMSLQAVRSRQYERAAWNSPVLGLIVAVAPRGPVLGRTCSDARATGPSSLTIVATRSGRVLKAVEAGHVLRTRINHTFSHNHHLSSIVGSICIDPPGCTLSACREVHRI